MLGRYDTPSLLASSPVAPPFRCSRPWKSPASRVSPTARGLNFRRASRWSSDPNGSGKSNIVDAIKWVLGEQSVKSLRGSEMADVIFNGSGTRRALNAAEITLTFDNAKRLLAIDSPEVHITRRVYRSGEGEYLINRNPARLRDIRDLLAGTGMGAQAYSVIEQGKVDVLLQSSARDRRVIFEEAAGISRFKLRKVEALRRLERVEQNLLRLSDIVDEVENQLRSVRVQAGKARRYKEHTERLQELRTQVAQVDWKRLSEQLGEFEGELQSLADRRGAAAAESEKLAAQLLEIDNRAAQIGEQIHQAESQVAANRERIAAAESTVEHERRHWPIWKQEIARYQRQLEGMAAKADELQQQLRDTRESLAAAEENRLQAAQRLVEAEAGLAESLASLEQLRGDSHRRREAYVEQMRLAAALGSEASALESQAAAAAAARQRAAERIAEIDAQLRHAGAAIGRAAPPSRTIHSAGSRRGPSRWPPPRTASTISGSNTTCGKRNLPSCASDTAAPPNAPRCWMNSSAARKA